MKIISKDEVNPRCPYCNQTLTEIHRLKKTFPGPFVAPVSVFFCPHCLKVLSITTWYSW